MVLKCVVTKKKHQSKNPDLKSSSMCRPHYIDQQAISQTGLILCVEDTTKTKFNVYNMEVESFSKAEILPCGY